MIDICLVSNVDYYIIVSIPETEADEYQERLNNDLAFREKEIQDALRNTTNTRALPSGTIEYQSDMDLDDIEAAVDAEAGLGVFLDICTCAGWAFEAADILEILKLSKKANVFVFAADILGTLVSYTQSKRVEWWNQAILDICNRKISAVRYTIVQNTSEYPKVWRVFERI